MEELLLEYTDFIRQAATSYRKYFEKDDLMSIAREGFIRAWQGWRRAYWKFEEYAAFAIRETLDEAKPLYCRNLRVESNLSLDKKLPSGNGTYERRLPVTIVNFISRLYLNELFERMDECHRDVCRLYSMCFNDEEIINYLGISQERLEELKEQIRLFWMDYDEGVKDQYAGTELGEK